MTSSPARSRFSPILRESASFALRPDKLSSPADQAGLEGMRQIGVPWQDADRVAMLPAGPARDRAVKHPDVATRGLTSTARLEGGTVVAHAHGRRRGNVAQRVDQAVEQLHLHVLGS